MWLSPNGDSERRKARRKSLTPRPANRPRFLALRRDVQDIMSLHHQINAACKDQTFGAGASDPESEPSSRLWLKDSATSPDSAAGHDCESECLLSLFIGEPAAKLVEKLPATEEEGIVSAGALVLDEAFLAHLLVVLNRLAKMFKQMVKAKSVSAFKKYLAVRPSLLHPFVWSCSFRAGGCVWVWGCMAVGVSLNRDYHP